MNPEELSHRLAAVLTPTLGAVTIENLRELSGGASRSTWSFDAVTESERHPLILRAGPGDELHADMAAEARAQIAAAGAGAPVPHIIAADDSAAALGSPYLICQAIAGETIVRRIFRNLDAAGGDARLRLLTQCATALAAIHRVDAAVAGDRPADQLTVWRDELDAATPPGAASAVFEWAFRWLVRHRPPDGPITLVHGDFRMGNLIVDEAGLAAVLDWELMHPGAATEDLAWFCIRAWRFGADAEAGGLGEIEEFLRAYERAAGVDVDRAEFRWQLVLATLRWGVICRYQAHRHLTGETRSVELATIGRRVAETEWDLLALLAPAPAPPAPEPAPAPPGLYGRPTAAELIEAVTEFLTTEVAAATDGAVNFHTRVAANALRIVQRELALAGAGTAAAQAALRKLGYHDEAGLAAAIRSGAPAGTAATDEDVLTCLRTLVGARLAVDHPGYAGPTDRAQRPAQQSGSATDG